MMSSHKRHASEDLCCLRSKLQRSESKRSIILPTKLNISCDDTLVRDIEELSLVWIDNNIHRNEDCICTELELRRVFGNVKTFNDSNNCMTYLKTLPHNHDRVFLVVSGALGITLLESIQTMEVVIWVYVFCENEAFHTEWAKAYSKVRGIFVERVALFSRLMPDVATYSIHLTPMSIFQSDHKQKSIDNLNSSTASFMWFQLLIRIIITMTDNRGARAKKDLIDACRKRYEGNEHEQQRITEFDNNYTTGQAIYWYTKDSFLYRSVNRAFRTADIDIIYKFRFIIAEIHEQLSSLPRPCTANLIVYRGQVISTAEMRIIEANQNGGFVSMNTFLSTSENFDQATSFSGVDTGVPEGLEPVIYQITVGQTRQPFANIDGLSAIPTENEILFSIGTVFRIDEVEKWPSGWIVSMTLTTEVEERFDALVNHFLDEIGQNPTLAMLGKFLVMQGDYNRAQRYFQFLIDENEPHLDEQGKFICYEFLGRILNEKGEYKKSMNYLQQVLTIQQHRLKPDDPDFSIIYSDIGAVQMNMGQFDEAMKNFQLALSIDLHCQPENKKAICGSYNNVAVMYNEMGEYLKAAENYEKSLEKQLELGFDILKHPTIAITYNNLGLLSKDMRKHDRAIDYLEKALAIQEASLPAEHPERIVTENSLANAYLDLGDHKLALEKCLIILDIKLKRQPPNFPSLSCTYLNLGSIYLSSGNFNKAEEQYRIAQQINERGLPHNHRQTGRNHQLLGDLYDAMGKKDKALNHYQRALDIFQHQKPLDHKALGQAYTNMGSIEQNPQKAIEYFEKGVAILSSADLIDQKALAFAYNALGTGYEEDKQLGEATTYYMKALELGRELVNGDENDPSLSVYYNNLSSTFVQQGDVNKGLGYACKAHDNLLKIQNPLHPTMGKIYNALGCCYNMLNNYESSLEFYQKTIDVYKQPIAENLRLLAKTYENIASVYDSMNDWDKSVEYYKMALDLRVKKFDSNDPELVVTYSSLAFSYEDKEDYAIALTYFVPMLTIQQKILSSFDLELAEAYDRVGTCYCLNKEYQRAVELFEKALNIQRSQKVSVASTYESLGKAYQCLNQLDAASNNYDMAIRSLIEEGQREKDDDYYEDLCRMHKNLGNIQQQLNIFDKALDNLNQSLTLHEEFLADNDETEKLRHEILISLAKINGQTKKDCQIETENHELALSIIR